MVPTSETLTFEHSYTWWGNARKLRVAAQPNVTLTAAHVPRQCRGARTVLLGPLMPQDMDCASFIQPTGELHFFQAGRILDNPWDPLTITGMRPARAASAVVGIRGLSPDSLQACAPIMWLFGPFLKSPSASVSRPQPTLRGA